MLFTVYEVKCTVYKRMLWGGTLYIIVIICVNFYLYHKCLVQCFFLFCLFVVVFFSWNYFVFYFYKLAMNKIFIQHANIGLQT